MTERSYFENQTSYLTLFCLNLSLLFCFVTIYNPIFLLLMHLIEKLDKKLFWNQQLKKSFFRSWMETWWKNLNVKCSKIVSLWHLWQKKCNYTLWKTSVTPLGLNHFPIFGSTYNILNLILSNYTFRLRRLNCCVWLPGST